MATQRIENAQSTSAVSTLVSKALNDLASLKCLAPLTSIFCKGSGEFGRHIESSLNQMTKEQSILKLKLRKSDAAVVIGVAQYQAILDMKQHYAELVEKVRVLELTQAVSEYDHLFQQIASPASRQAADALFEASEEELNNTYKG